MKLRELKTTILSDEDVNPSKNEEAFAELIQFLDDKSLSLIIRDAVDDGRNALKILRAHFAGTGKPRIISLYTELTSLIKSPEESVTDYVIRAEKAFTALNNAKETVSDDILIAMVLKGLPESFKLFVVFITQSDKKQSSTEFKVALRSFEDAEKSKMTESDSIMKLKYIPSENGRQSKNQGGFICFKCNQSGYIARNCSVDDKRKSEMWCSTCHSGTHNDRSCRRQKWGRKDKANRVIEEEVEHSFVFAMNTGTNESKVGKPNSLLVDCGATSNIITDKSKFTRFDSTFDPSKHYTEIANGAKANNVDLSWGDVEVVIQDKGGNPKKVTLTNALYIPSYPQDIFSVQAATDRGACKMFQPDHAELKYKDGTEFSTEKNGRLYYLKTFEINIESDSVNYSRDIKELHAILGHCNYEDIIKLEDVVDGMTVTGKNCVKPGDCNTCILGKFADSRSRKPDAKAKVPLALVHTDLSGPVVPVSRDGFKYCFAVYFLKNKSDAVRATEKFLADVAPYCTVKCMRSDGGGEFISKDFESLL